MTDDCLSWYKEKFLDLSESGDFDMGCRYKALFKCFELVYKLDKFSSGYNFSKLLETAWINGLIPNYFDDFYNKLLKEKKEKLKTSDNAQSVIESLRALYKTVKRRETNE